MIYIYYYFQRLLYFSCNDDILGIFPTIIFITSIGVVLYKDGYQNSIEDSQQQFLQVFGTHINY